MNVVPLQKKTKKHLPDKFSGKMGLGQNAMACKKENWYMANSINQS